MRFHKATERTSGLARWMGLVVALCTVLPAGLAFADAGAAPLIWRQHKISPSTDVQCKASCDSDEVCRAWARTSEQCVNFADPLAGVPGPGYKGWGLRSTPVPTAQAIDARRQAWQAPPKAPRANFAYHGMDIDGVNLPAHEGAAECSARCRLDINCKAWSLYRGKPEESPTCWTKFTLGSPAEDGYTTSGLPDEPPPSAAEIAERLATLRREAQQAAQRPARELPAVWRSHTIVPATNALCQASCDSDDVCRAWSRFRDRCTNWLAPLPASRLGEFEGAGLRSTRLPTEEDVESRRAQWDALPKGGRANFVHHGMDIIGYFLGRGQGEEDCKRLCRDDPHCKAWSVLRERPQDSGTCWTKFALGPPGHDNRLLSGLRDTPLPTLREQHAKAARLQREAAAVVELHRPRLVPRTLSAEEQAEARALAQAYKEQPQWATLDKLWLLAESGDREAMKLVLQAGPAPKDAPFESLDAHNIAANLHALWGALYWSSFGADRDAARAISIAGPNSSVTVGGKSPCVGHFDCGYMATFAPGSPLAQNLEAYANTGENPPQVSFSFHQAVPRSLADKTRFDNLMAALNQGLPVWPGDAGFMDHYAGLRGLRPQLEQARANNKVAAARLESQRQEDLRQRVMARWRSLVKGDRVHAQTPYAVLEQVEGMASYLGGEQLESLAAHYNFQRSSTAERLCAQGSRLCAAQRQHAAKAELAARVSAAQAAGRGGTGLVTQPSANVQVRVYDRNGNYTGTTTMSGLEAELLGVKR